MGCAALWVTFSPKILTKHGGSRFGLKKKSLEWVPFHKNCQKKKKKNGKISHFEVEKPLEMGPDLRNFRKNRQISRFLRE